MKISKSFLSKIIKEEIKRALYNESSDEDPQWAKPMINLFIKINTEMGNSNPDSKIKQNYKKQIEDLSGEDVVSVFKFLRGKIDYQLYRDVAQLLNSEISTNLFGDDDLRSPTYRPNPKRSEIDDIRSAKEDPRKDPITGVERKNLVH